MDETVKGILDFLSESKIAWLTVVVVAIALRHLHRIASLEKHPSGIARAIVGLFPLAAISVFLLALGYDTAGWVFFGLFVLLLLVDSGYLDRFHPESSPAYVKGTVRDSNNGHPIDAAIVYVVCSHDNRRPPPSWTDANGTYKIRVEHFEGDAEVHVDKQGYDGSVPQKIGVEKGKTKTVDFKLDTKPQVQRDPPLQGDNPT